MVKVVAIGHAQTGIRWEHSYPYVGEESRSVWELYESDQVREFYLRADHRPGVVLVFESDDVSEAERLVAALPIVKAGLLNFEVIPLRPYIGILESSLRIQRNLQGSLRACSIGLQLGSSSIPKTALQVLSGLTC